MDVLRCWSIRRAALRLRIAKSGLEHAGRSFYPTVPCHFATLGDSHVLLSIASSIPLTRPYRYQPGLVSNLRHQCHRLASHTLLGFRLYPNLRLLPTRSTAAPQCLWYATQPRQLRQSQRKPRHSRFRWHSLFNKALNRRDVDAALNNYHHLRHHGYLTMLRNRHFQLLVSLLCQELPMPSHTCHKLTPPRQTPTPLSISGWILAVCHDWLERMGLYLGKAGSRYSHHSHPPTTAAFSRASPVCLASDALTPTSVTLSIRPTNLTLILVALCRAKHLHFATKLLLVLPTSGYSPPPMLIKALCASFQLHHYPPGLLALVHLSNEHCIHLQKYVYDQILQYLLDHNSHCSIGEVWDAWLASGKAVTAYSFNRMLRWLARQRDQTRVLATLAALPTLGLTLGKREYDTLIMSLGRIGCVSQALAVYQTMRHERQAPPDVATYGILVNVLLYNQRIAVVEQLYGQLRQLQVSIDIRLCIDLMASYAVAANTAMVYQLHKHLLRTEAPIDSIGFNRLISIFGRLGHMDQVLRLFNSIPLVSSKSAQLETSHLVSTIHACLLNRAHLLIPALFHRYQHIGLQPTVELFNVLIRYWVQTQQWTQATTVLTTMAKVHVEPDANTFRFLITGLGYSGYLAEALDLYLYMVNQCQLPPSQSLLIYLMVQCQRSGLCDMARHFRQLLLPYVPVMGEQDLTLLLQHTLHAQDTPLLQQVLDAVSVDSTMVSRTTSAVLVCAYWRAWKIPQALQWFDYHMHQSQGWLLDGAAVECMAQLAALNSDVALIDRMYNHQRSVNLTQGRASQSLLELSGWAALVRAYTSFGYHQRAWQVWEHAAMALEFTVPSSASTASNEILERRPGVQPNRKSLTNLATNSPDYIIDGFLEAILELVLTTARPHDAFADISQHPHIAHWLGLTGGMDMALPQIGLDRMATLWSNLFMRCIENPKRFDQALLILTHFMPKFQLSPTTKHLDVAYRQLVVNAKGSPRAQKVYQAIAYQLASSDPTLTAYWQHLWDQPFKDTTT